MLTATSYSQLGKATAAGRGTTAVTDRNTTRGAKETAAVRSKITSLPHFLVWVKGR